jgi:carbon storage regulator
MRVIPCKLQESLRIGEVKVTVIQIRGDRVRLRVDAPSHLAVYREEIIRDLSDAAHHALVGHEHRLNAE